MWMGINNMNRHFKAVNIIYGWVGALGPAAGKSAHFIRSYATNTVKQTKCTYSIRAFRELLHNFMK